MKSGRFQKSAIGMLVAVENVQRFRRNYGLKIHPAYKKKKTTNACESFRDKRNKLFYTSQSNIFIFFHVLKRFQLNTRTNSR